MSTAAPPTSIEPPCLRSPPCPCVRTRRRPWRNPARSLPPSLCPCRTRRSGAGAPAAAGAALPEGRGWGAGLDAAWPAAPPPGRDALRCGMGGGGLRGRPKRSSPCLAALAGSLLPLNLPAGAPRRMMASRGYDMTPTGAKAKQKSDPRHPQMPGCGEIDTETRSLLVAGYYVSWY